MLDPLLINLKHERVQLAFLQFEDQVIARIDREFDLPNRTNQPLIHWIRQIQDQLPNRRGAPELAPLQPGQLERIEAIVSESFFFGAAALQ